MKPLAKISWDPDRRIAQMWKRDRCGWFKAGWGFGIKDLAAEARKQGFRAMVVDHAEISGN
jgi:hypothetical protein